MPKNGSVDEGDEKDGLDAAQGREHGHDPRFVVHEKMFESLHRICCLRWLAADEGGRAAREAQKAALGSMH